MNQRERQALTRSRARSAAQAATERTAMMLGGYAGGRWMRNSKLGEYPMTLALGIVGLVGMRRARSLGGKGARLGMAGLVGTGCYGAGKLGEKHGVKAENDGNLFSWGKGGATPSSKNEFYTD